MEEEIKLVIILILTLCTFVKLRNWRTPSAKLLPPQKKQAATAMEQDDKEQQVDAQAIAKFENQLFPPTPALPPSLPSRPQPTAYSKSIVGITYEEDPSNLYSSRYMDSNPFQTGSRRVVRSNEDYLREIQHLLIDPPVYQRPLVFSMPSPMRPQEESSSQHPKKTPLKRKNISKSHRLGKKKPIQSRPSLKPLFSQLPLQMGKKRQKESVVDIDKEIQRRREEIKILERLKKRRGGTKLI